MNAAIRPSLCLYVWRISANTTILRVMSAFSMNRFYLLYVKCRFHVHVGKSLTVLARVLKYRQRLHVLIVCLKQDKNR